MYVFLGILIGEETSPYMVHPVVKSLRTGRSSSLYSALTVLMGDILIFIFRIRMTNADEISHNCKKIEMNVDFFLLL